MGMDWFALHSKGPCQGCGRTFREKDCYKGRCLPCRVPEDRRELVKYGVPWSTANGMALIMKKCNGQAEFVLGKVHPRLMANIVVRSGVLKIRDKKWHWVRRNGWAKVR